MFPPFRHAIDDGLDGAALQVFVSLVVSPGEVEGVRPTAVLNADFRLGGEGKVVIVEALYVPGQVCPRSVVPQFHSPHGVVVPAVFNADGRLDGCVQVILFLFAGHDVDGTPHGVAPQVRGHDSLIDLDALDGTYRQVGEGGALALDVQGYFVDEIADGVSRHAVQREVGV